MPTNVIYIPHSFKGLHPKTAWNPTTRLKSHPIRRIVHGA